MAGEVAVAPATSEPPPASNEDLDITTDRASGITWYRPKFEYWQIDDFKIYPSIGVNLAGERQMILTVIVKDPPDGVPAAVHLSGGKEGWIIPIGDPGSVTNRDSGCRVTQTITLGNQADAVLNLGESTIAEARLTGYERTVTFKVPTADLEGIRRIARLWSEPVLPLATPKSAKPEPKGPTPDDLAAGVFTNPELIRKSKVPPKFPSRARGKQALGHVKLQAVIRKDGSVGDITVLEGAGGDCGFEAAAVDALSRWRYKPGTKNGQPVEVYFTIEIDFTYDGYRAAH